MKYVKNIAKIIVIKFGPFISRHILLKQIMLFFLNLFPGTKEKILNYIKNKERVQGKLCYLEYGFGEFEGNGVWSVSSPCKIILLSPPSTKKNIELEIDGVFFRDDYVGHVFINSGRVAKWLPGNDLTLKLPREFYPSGELISITIEISNIKSPFDLVISEDKRTLGIFLKTIKINGVRQTFLNNNIFTKKANDIYITLMKKIDQKRGCNAHNA